MYRTFCSLLRPGCDGKGILELQSQRPHNTKIQKIQQAKLKIMITFSKNADDWSDQNYLDFFPHLCLIIILFQSSSPIYPPKLKTARSGNHNPNPFSMHGKLIRLSPRQCCHMMSLCVLSLNKNVFSAKLISSTTITAALIAICKTFLKKHCSLTDSYDLYD